MLRIKFLINILAIGLYQRNKYISFIFWNRISILMFSIQRLSHFLNNNQIKIFGYNSLWLFTATSIGSVSIFVFICFAGVCILIFGDVDCNSMYGDGVSLLFTVLGLRIHKKYLSNSSFIPAKSYSNTNTMRLSILKENKGKSGIYRWVNNNNGKSYVGCAKNLYKRLYSHFSLSYLKNPRNKNMQISRALLKYSYSVFSLEILEYCDIDILISKEQYYINLFEPEYNTLKTASSRLGLKHSELTKQKMSKNLKGENHPLFGVKSLDNPNFGKKHSEESIEKINQALGITIYIYSLDYKLLYTFTSTTKAKLHFKSKTYTILKYAQSGEIFRGEYIFSLGIIKAPSE